MRVRSISDSVNNRVPQSCICVFVIDFGSETVLTFSEQTHSHFFEQFKVLFNGSVSVSWWLASISIGFHFLFSFIANESISVSDQLDCKFVQLLEIVTCMSYFPRIVAHPTDILFNVINELLVLFDWVCVIKSQIAMTTWHLCLHEIESHSFTMTNVEISVWLRREPSQNDTFTKLLTSPFEILFAINCRVHFSANQLRDIFNMELFLFFFFNLSGSLLFLYCCLFWFGWCFFVSGHRLIGKSFSFPWCF